MTIDDLLKGKYFYVKFTNDKLEMYTSLFHMIPYYNWSDIFPFAIPPIDSSKIKSIVRRPTRGFIVVTNNEQVYAIQKDETLEQLLERVCR